MPLFPGDPPPQAIPRLRPEQIQKLANEAVSPRAERMRLYRSYYDGTQYAGRLPFLETRFDAPLRERAPCVVSDCVRAAARANAARCLGEGRFPSLTTLQSEDDAAFDERFGLSPEDSAVLDALIEKIVDQADLQTASRIALESAQAVGTACSLQCVDASGQLAVQDLPAEWCEPTRDASGDVASLELLYRYVDSVRDPVDGKFFQVVREYRRYVDAQQDATFFPRLVLPAETGIKPSWVVDRQVAHGLGFCPVVWYPFLSAGSASTISYDGRPLHDNQLENIDSLNFALSQRHRGAYVCGEPQYTATGVSEDDIGGSRGRAAAGGFAPVQNNPAPAPTAANPQALPQSALPKGTTGWMQSTSMPGAGSRLKRSPYNVWSAEEVGAKFDMLSMPGDALEPLNEDAKEILGQLRETFGVVFLDPATLAGTADISGKALLVMNERQVAFCDSVRRDFWRRWLRPVLCQFLRITLAKAGKGLYLGGTKKAQPILQKFVQPVEASVSNGQRQQSDGQQARTRWFDPRVEARWGDYFPPSDLDQKQAIDNAVALRKARLATEKAAIELVAPILNVKNIDAYVDELHKDLEENPPFVPDLSQYAAFEPKSPEHAEEMAEQERQDNLDVEANKAKAIASKPSPFGGGPPGAAAKKPPFGGKPASKPAGGSA